MASLTQQEFEIIVNSTRDGMIAVNREDVVTLFNRAAERITGLRAEEVVAARPGQPLPQRHGL